VHCIPCVNCGARDHAINAVRNFEAAQRYANSGAQMRQGAEMEKTREEKQSGYGRSKGPPWMPPFGFGMGGRDEEKRREPDSWPMKK